MPSALTQSGVAMLLLGIDNFVHLAHAFECRSTSDAPAELIAVSRSLVDTARGVGASEGDLVGYLRHRWPGNAALALEGEDAATDVYFTVIRLLHAEWIRAVG